MEAGYRTQASNTATKVATRSVPHLQFLSLLGEFCERRAPTRNALSSVGEEVSEKNASMRAYLAKGNHVMFE